MAVPVLAERPCQAGRHLLRFEPLSRHGRALRFPCNERGEVDLDALGEGERNDYFFAGAMVGRLYRKPRVVVAE